MTDVIVHEGPLNSREYEEIRRKLTEQLGHSRFSIVFGKRARKGDFDEARNDRDDRWDGS